VDLSKFANFSLTFCGLLGILMAGMALVAFFRNRGKISNRTGIVIIVAILFLVILVLAVAEN